MTTVRQWTLGYRMGRDRAAYALTREGATPAAILESRARWIAASERASAPALAEHCSAYAAGLLDALNAHVATLDPA